MSEGGEQWGIARFFEDIDLDQKREHEGRTEKLWTLGRCKWGTSSLCIVVTGGSQIVVYFSKIVSLNVTSSISSQISGSFWYDIINSDPHGLLNNGHYTYVWIILSFHFLITQVLISGPLQHTEYNLFYSLILLFFCSPGFALREALKYSMEYISKMPHKAVYGIHLQINPHILHSLFLRLVNDHDKGLWEIRVSWEIQR